MAQSQQLLQICSVPEDQRDETWEFNFFQALVEGDIGVTNAEPQEGPDGWPYMMVETSANANEPALKLLGWLSEKGIGLAVNPQKDMPDYVFSYGMIWNYRETAQFISKTAEVKSGDVEFKEGQKLVAGEPSAQYLPRYVKDILQTFLEDQGIKNPKILVVSTDQKHYDLCFSVESLGNPKKEDHAAIAEAISWFLPTHYSLMLVSEEGLPPFVAL